MFWAATSGLNTTQVVQFILETIDNNPIPSARNSDLNLEQQSRGAYIEPETQQSVYETYDSSLSRIKNLSLNNSSINESYIESDD